MEPKQESFYINYSNEEKFDTSHTEQIFQCEDDNPPSRKIASVKELCTINYELDIPYHSLEDFTTANGRELKRFHFQIKMIPSGASNEFSIHYQGEKLGSQIARIAFQE